MTDDEIMAVFRAMGLTEEFIQRFELLRVALDPPPPGVSITTTGDTIDHALEEYPALLARLAGDTTNTAEPRTAPLFTEKDVERLRDAASNLHTFFCDASDLDDLADRIEAYLATERPDE